MKQSSGRKIQIWGRRNSVNVQKVLWCAEELGLAVERIDAGMAFGRNHDADYLAMNPNGGIPTLVDDDFILWESNSIMRYLAAEYDGLWLYPANPRFRAGIDRWLDWTLSRVQPTERAAFWGLIRTPEAERDMKAIASSLEASGKLWQMLDAHLATRSFAEAESFTIADIALAAYVRRWFGFEAVSKPGSSTPALPYLKSWYERLEKRPAFQIHLGQALS